MKHVKPADDEEFLRRAALDISGTIPTPDDVRLFLKDKSKNKRQRAIDALREGMRRNKDRAVMVLPQPDSPTMPRVSP